MVGLRFIEPSKAVRSISRWVAVVRPEGFRREMWRAPFLPRLVSI